VKRLCFGSYAKIFALRKSAAGKSQKNISSSIALSIAPDYFIGDEDRTTSDWVICKKNLPDEVITGAKTILENDECKKFRDAFSKSVLPLINENKYSDIVLALKDIIANDSEIQPTAVVDKVSNTTKADLMKMDTFDIADFLAGVILYAVTVVNNADGKLAIKEIDDDYMSQFANRESEVHFVDKIDSTAQSTTEDGEQFSSGVEGEVVDGVRIENDFQPNLQQNIYNQTIDVKGNNNTVSGFVFNSNNRG